MAKDNRKRGGDRGWGVHAMDDIGREMFGNPELMKIYFWKPWLMALKATLADSEQNLEILADAAQNLETLADLAKNLEILVNGAHWKS